MIRDAARDFAHAELLPGVIERDNAQSFPADAVKKMGELGFYGHDDFTRLPRRRDGYDFVRVGHGRNFQNRCLGVGRYECQQFIGLLGA